MIRHIWFDFSETLVFLREERSNQLRYATYAAVVGKPIDETLIAEYEQLYSQHANSNSAVFRSLGLPGNYWSEHVNATDPREMYILADPNIPTVLKTLQQSIPISIFSTLQLDVILAPLGLDPKLFTHTLGPDIVQEPKPALEGFYKMIELSTVPPENILYIGDHVKKDVRPAQHVGIKAGIMWKKSDEADYSFERFEDILNVIQ